MDEYIIVLQATIAMIASALTAGLYSLGGRKWKTWRRHIASLLFSVCFGCISLWQGKFNWWLLAIYPSLIFQYTLGYGGDDATKRVQKRFVIALVALATGIWLSFALSIPFWTAVVILAIQAIIGLISVIFAVKNPFQAAFEEAFVCMITTMPLMGYLFV